MWNNSAKKKSKNIYRVLLIVFDDERALCSWFWHQFSNGRCIDYSDFDHHHLDKPMIMFIGEWYAILFLLLISVQFQTTFAQVQQSLRTTEREKNQWNTRNYVDIRLLVMMRSFRLCVISLFGCMFLLRWLLSSIGENDSYELYSATLNDFIAFFSSLLVDKRLPWICQH